MTHNLLKSAYIVVEGERPASKPVPLFLSSSSRREFEERHRGIARRIPTTSGRKGQIADTKAVYESTNDVFRYFQVRATQRIHEGKRPPYKRRQSSGPHPGNAPAHLLSHQPADPLGRHAGPRTKTPRPQSKLKKCAKRVKKPFMESALAGIIGIPHHFFTLL